MRWLFEFRMRLRCHGRLARLIREADRALERQGVYPCACGDPPDFGFVIGMFGQPDASWFACNKCRGSVVMELAADNALRSWNDAQNVLNAEIVE